MLSNLRVSNYELNFDTIIIDTLSIIPNTIYIYDENNILIPDTLYIIDYAKSLFIPDNSLKKRIQKVKISYRYRYQLYIERDELVKTIENTSAQYKRNDVVYCKHKKCAKFL